MKLTLVTIAVLISTASALICCKISPDGTCPDPGNPGSRREVSVLTPKGYLNERTGAFDANPEGICCCFAQTRDQCSTVCPPPET